MKVLVVNAGSSSLKYQLMDTTTEEVLAKGICERIGMAGSLIDHKKADGTKIKKEIPMTDHSVATEIVVNMLTDKEYGCISSMDEIEAVGHRVVHGGPYISESCLVTDEVMDIIEKCIEFAPLHNPAHIMGIKGCQKVMPNTPQVAVFDTAFHQTMQPKAYTYALPIKMVEEDHIRRYGMHGTSHKFVSQEMNKILNKEDSKIVTCHIGNGSSISAVRDGKVVDTSMGFTPLDGVEMGTRCGSIDPAIVPYIMKKYNIGVDEITDFMNKKCGFLGVSGYSSDSRDIEAAILGKFNDELPGAPKTDEEKAITTKHAQLAADILAFQVKKYIGSYSAIMNGLDAIVFTAGMGENNPELRDRVCRDMEFLGIDIDFELNAKTLRQPNTVELSTPKSKVKVYVLPTNEELMIARDTEAIVSKL
ncbi:MAG: acetate kinase [Ruminococcaceae bacterium]|nr:acetate kinase [Oscillospiraceae bacterium]